MVHSAHAYLENQCHCYPDDTGKQQAPNQNSQHIDLTVTLPGLHRSNRIDRLWRLGTFLRTFFGPSLRPVLGRLIRVGVRHSRLLSVTFAVAFVSLPTASRPFGSAVRPADARYRCPMPDARRRLHSWSFGLHGHQVCMVMRVCTLTGLKLSDTQWPTLRSNSGRTAFLTIHSRLQEFREPSGFPRILLEYPSTTGHRQT